jgi:hypothetical protein
VAVRFAVALLAPLGALGAFGTLGACSPFEDCVPGTIDCPADAAWSVGPAMPRRALDPGVAALGLQVVVAGGFATGPSEGREITARVDAFDTTDAMWRALPDAPVRWTHINLATVGATLYITGGLEGAQRTAHGEAFALDAVTRTWRPIAAMDPGDARGASGVVTAQGRIYLLGGASSAGALASSLEYDIAQDRWTRLPDLPAPRAQPTAMRMPDGTLIVAGGVESLDATQPRSEVWALPPPGSASRTWQPRSPMPVDQAARGGCAYGVVLGELVCAGGVGGPCARSTVESYAPYTDVWTAREPMPVERAGTQGAVVGGRLFVPGGAGTLALEPTDTLYIYTPLDISP